MRVIRRITPDNMDLLQPIADSVLTGEETLVRISRSGFSLEYMPLLKAQWRSFPPVFSAEPVRLLRDPWGAVFAAFDDDQFIGQASLRIDPDTCWCQLLDIRVDAAFRRSGAGDMLLSACDRFALQHGAVGLRVTVPEDHPAMCQFCVHNRFTLSGLDRMALWGTEKERRKPLARKSSALLFYRFSEQT